MNKNNITLYFPCKVSQSSFSFSIYIKKLRKISDLNFKNSFFLRKKETILPLPPTN